MVTFKFLCRIVLPKFYPGLSCESYHKGVYTLMWEYLHECVGDSFFLEKYLTLFPDAIYTDFGVIYDTCDHINSDSCDDIYEVISTDICSIWNCLGNMS